VVQLLGTRRLDQQVTVARLEARHHPAAVTGVIRLEHSGLVFTHVGE
jgi:hypothetical protein